MNYERFPWKFRENRATAGKQVSQRDTLQTVPRSKEITPVPEAWKCSSFTKIPPDNHKNLFENRGILQLLILKVNDFFISWKELPLQPKPVSDSINNLFSFRHEKRESSTASSEKVLHLDMYPHRNFQEPFSFSLTCFVCFQFKKTNCLFSIQNKQDLYCIPKLSDLYDQSSTCSCFQTVKG